MGIETFSGYISELKPNEIFVFGSNPEGRHGGGTAKIAFLRFGAVYGKGRGLSGQSYGLITKNLKSGYREKLSGRTLIYKKSGTRSVPPKYIMKNISELYQTANEMKNYKFLVAYTAGGKNLCGYSAVEMASFFRDAGEIPENIIFEDKFYSQIFNF